MTDLTFLTTLLLYLSCGVGGYLRAPGGMPPPTSPNPNPNPNLYPNLYPDPSRYPNLNPKPGMPAPNVLDSFRPTGALMVAHVASLSPWP